MRIRSNNPVFKRALGADYIYEGASATYAGVTGKVIFYILMTLLGASIGLFLNATNQNLLYSLLGVAVFTTFIFGLIGLMSPRLAKVMGTLYCLNQGMLIGIVSLIFNQFAPGSAIIAVLSTIVVLVVVATLFLTNIVKVNDKFMRFLTTFSISILISMLLIWILGYSFGSNLIISLIMVFLATLYILFDFEHIRQVVEGGAPKELEWYVAFGLVFTILWLYMEILPIVVRLIARDN